MKHLVHCWNPNENVVHQWNPNENVVYHRNPNEKIAKLNCSLVSIVTLFAVRARENGSLISLFKHFLISQTTRDATDHDGIERPLPEQRLTTNSEKDGSKIRWLPQNPSSPTQLR